MNLFFLCFSLFPVTLCIFSYTNKDYNYYTRGTKLLHLKQKKGKYHMYYKLFRFMNLDFQMKIIYAKP